MSDSATIVQKLWNYCNVLRDDGLSYQDYIEQLTFLLFLKMADERGHGVVRSVELTSELEKHAREVGIRSVVSKTDAFPMVGIIEALLGRDSRSPGAENASTDGNASHAGPGKL